jgi:outer membrane protein OmpA-like peptidoglycan-associated protein
MSYNRRSACYTLFFLFMSLNISFAQSGEKTFGVNILVSPEGKKTHVSLAGAGIVILKNKMPFVKVQSLDGKPQHVELSYNAEYAITVSLEGYNSNAYYLRLKNQDASNTPEAGQTPVLGVALVKSLSAIPSVSDFFIAYMPSTNTFDVMNDPEILGYRVSNNIDYSALMLIQKKGKTKPEKLTDAKVMLKDSVGTVMQTTRTGKDGGFTFTQICPDNRYNISLENSAAIPADAKVFLARTNGDVVQTLKKDKANAGFEYALLPAEMHALSALKEEDPQLKVMHFELSGEKEITFVQSITYESDKWEVTPMARLDFDRIIIIMKSNPKLKLVINSHTDAKGDDAYNMKLSEKRAQAAVAYLVSKGVESSRVSGKGFGETKLLNRCKNGVECSEEEHKANRRTEFRFVKGD